MERKNSSYTGPELKVVNISGINYRISDFYIPHGIRANFVNFQIRTDRLSKISSIMESGLVIEY